MISLIGDGYGVVEMKLTLGALFAKLKSASAATAVEMRKVRRRAKKRVKDCILSGVW